MLIDGTDNDDTINGSPTADVVNGLAGNDNVNGGDGNDQVTGGAGDDKIYGGDGSDTAVFSGSMQDYQIEYENGIFTVTDLNPSDGDDGVDTLERVEKMSFSDATLTFPLSDQGDLQGNSTTNNLTYGTAPHPIALLNGEFGVVTQNTQGVWLTRYDVNGASIGQPSLISNNASFWDATVDAASLPDGRFVVMWRSDAQSMLYGRTFDANGAAEGPPFELFQDAYDQYSHIYELTGLNDGSFVVQRFSQESNHADGLWVQRYSSNGIEMGAPLTITDNSYVAYHSGTAIGDSDFLLCWSEVNDEYKSALYAQRFDILGEPVGDRIEIDPVTPGQSPRESSIAALEGGGFAVIWWEGTHSIGNESAGGYPDGFRVNYQVYGEDGEPLGGAVLLADGGYLSAVKVTATADGGFILSWFDDSNINIQLCDASGDPVGELYELPAYTFDHDVVALDNGGFVVTWTSDFDTSHVMRFSADGEPAVEIDGRVVVTGTAAANTLAYTQGAALIEAGDGNDTVNGSAYADILRGQAGDDTVSGAAGDDDVYGGVGLDTLAGGEGNDNLYGEAGNDNLSGGAGNDVLDGGTGDDVMAGGIGNDTYVVDSLADQVSESGAQGTDTIRAYFDYELGNNLENLVLLGAGDIDGTGNSLINSITGNAGANVLDGGGGADTLTGGAGDDTYIVNSTGDVVIEDFGGGTDTTVTSLATWTLHSGVENLIFTGSVGNTAVGNSSHNTIDGGAGNDNLRGGYGDDVLIGGDGNDRLEGETGNDQLLGGLGDDTYVVDNASDIIDETGGGGTDTVESHIDWTLDDGLESLKLVGYDNIEGTGNDLDNRIDGNGANNHLYGGAGNDLISGGWGSDVLAGGLGDDTYFIDDIYDVVVEEAGEGIDLVRTTEDWTLAEGIENLELLDFNHGTGNELANHIIGCDYAFNNLRGLGGNDLLDGGLGGDYMFGGTGNDVYIVDTEFETITEAVGEGNDEARSSVSYTLSANVEILRLTGAVAINGTGNISNNYIYGNAAANTLNGGTGADYLAGGAGSDTYYTDGGDWIVEAAGGGADTVRSSATHVLTANVEHLVLTGSSAINGTGNTLNNYITGNNVANMLNGSTGIDVLTGAGGNDTYFTDGGDAIIEQFNQGIDTVLSGANHTLSANVEHLVLTGTGAFNGIGNTLNNSITGNTGVNSLRGGIGNDVLSGGAGGDKLYGEAGNDTLTGGAGLDVFAFTTALGAANVDRIADFSTVEDTIHLENAIFTRLTVAGNLSAGNFRSGANISTAADANDYIIYNTTTGDLFYDQDGSGVGVAVRFATLTGSPDALSHADFVVI